VIGYATRDELEAALYALQKFEAEYPGLPARVHLPCGTAMSRGERCQCDNDE
jgi:hypothetical protein